MKLPKIAQTQSLLKRSYFESIIAKPLRKYKNDKLQIDWQSGEIDLINKLPDTKNMLDALIQLQVVCKNASVPHFYTYYFVNKVVAEQLSTCSMVQNNDEANPKNQQHKISKNEENAITKIYSQIENIKTKKSKWNKIVQLINFRQNIVSKINEAVAKNKLEFVHASLDDIRHINAQIIRGIVSWQCENATESELPPIFMFEGRNYLIKMVNDNAIVIDILNVGAFKFLSPPNPFYLSKDGNKTSMSQTQQIEINDCMQLLAKQKANELKILLNPPKYALLTKQHPNDVNFARIQNDLQKAQRIRSIYKSTNNLGITISGLRKFNAFSTQKQKQKQKLENQLQKPSSKKRQKFGKIQNEKRNAKSTDRIINYSQSNPIMAKIQNLKKSVQQNKQTSRNIKLDAITALQNQKLQTQKGQNLIKVAIYSSQNTNLKSMTQNKSKLIKMKIMKQKQKQQQRERQRQRQKQRKKQKQIQEQKPNNNGIIQNNQDKKRQTLYQKRLTNSQSKNNKQLSSSEKKQQKIENQRFASETKQKKSFRIKKQPIIDNAGSQEVDIKQSLENSEFQLRMRLRQLRNQSIMQIYGKKRISTPKIDRQSINNTKNKRQQQKIQQKQLLELQLKQVQKRIQQMSSNKNRNSNSKKQKKQKMKKQQQEKLIKIQQAIKNENEKKQKQIEFQQNQRQKLLSSLNIKQQKIKQLFDLLNKQQINYQAQSNSKQENLQDFKNKKLKQIQELKQTLKNQNRLIKQQMEQQQKKFMRLKEAQYQMIEEQLNKKHEQEKQMIKQQFTKLNRELEQKILEQEKKRRQNQLKLMQEKRQLEQLKIQMEEKLLREKLLEEILKEQGERNYINQQQQQLLQAERAERLKRQILQRQAAERKIIENIQQDNRKLKDMFQEIKRRNEQLQLNNERKMREIHKVKEQVKEQVYNQNELQKQLSMARKQILQQKIKTVQLEQQKQSAQRSSQDIEQLKLKVKQEILKAMLMKKEEEQAQRKKDEQQKAKRLAEIQNQIRNQLRRQEEEMQRIQQQQRQRYERIKKQLEEQHLRKMKELQQQDEKIQLLPQAEAVRKQLMDQNSTHNKQSLNELNNFLRNQQSQDKPQIIQRHNQAKAENEELNKQAINLTIQNQLISKQTEQLAKENTKQNRLEEIQKVINKQHNLLQQQNHHSLSKQVKKPQSIKINLQTNNKNQSSINNSEELQRQSKQESTKHKSQVIDEKQNSNIKNMNTNMNKNEQLMKNLQTNKDQKVAQNQNKVQEEEKAEQKKQKKQSQVLPQSSEDILSKYQNLQQYLSKCKQIYIDDRAVPHFINTFMSQFNVETKQMLPYSPHDLEVFMLSQKKVDIFKSQVGHSIGWLETDKYILIGQISCVETIAKKYGQTQIQMTYIFNKTNPYQKQFLAKQVKIFDKIGFIFQKKLKQESMYSIKFVIKIPAEIVPKNFKTPTNQLHIRSKILVDDAQQSKTKVVKKSNQYSYFYLLSQTLKNCLNNQQLWSFKENTSQDAKLLQQKMENKSYNDTIFKTIQLSDKRIQSQVKLQLKYIQTHDFPCFVIKGAQFKNSNSQESQKFYIVQATQNLCVGIMPYQTHNSVLSLDLFLNIKTKRIKKERQILICLPIWMKNQTVHQDSLGPKKFVYSHSVEANISYGSIVSTTALKENFKLIQAPFIFALFQNDNDGLIIRTLIGQIVTEKDIVQQKR